MKKTEMREITYKVLVSISVFETIQSTEELLIDNCQKSDSVTQTDPTFIINHSKFLTILIVWFLWSLTYTGEI